MEGLVIIEVPEPESPFGPVRRGVSGSGPDQEALGVKADAPGHSPGVNFQLLLELATLPVHQQHHRLVNSAKGVGHLGESGHCQILAVGAEPHVTGTAHVSSELLIEAPHELRFPLSRDLPGLDLPLLDDTHQVKGSQPLAVRVKDDGVGVSLVPLEDVDQLPGAGVPELQQVVVTTRGQQATVGTGADPADPSVVCHQHSLRRRPRLGQGPDADSIVVST